MKCIRPCLIFLFFLSALTLFQDSAQAQDRFSAAIQANRSAVELMGGVEFDFPPSTLYLDANLLDQDDDYTIFGLQALVGNIIQIEALTGKIGFKGVIGEFERPGSDSDLAALAFSVAGVYDLSKVIASHHVPVTISAALNYAPEPLAYKDTEEYIEAIISADWRLIENGAIVASYRYLEADFEDPVKWQETDNSFYIGLKFMW